MKTSETARFHSSLCDLEAVMAKEKNETRVRLLRMLELLQNESDEQHPISTPDAIRLLKEKWGLEAYRITVQRDVEALVDAGYDVRTIHARQNRYYMASRTFEHAELKLLADAVASSKFITAAKSKALAEKITSMTNVQRANELKRNISVADRIKPKNEGIYQYIDAVNKAINEKKKIQFFYFTYTASKRKRLKNDGKPYTFSPYTLTWNGDCYYMVGWSDKHGKVATFRVDRIYATPMILEEPAVKRPKGYSIADFAEKAFQLFDGDRTTIDLLCHEDAMNSVLDHFSEKARIKQVDDTHFILNAEVSLSPTFFAWVFQFGGKVIIQGPEAASASYLELITKALNPA